MPFGSTEFVGLQHTEFGPTIPSLQSIDSFDAVPPVLSEEWSRLGKELSQCTGAEVVPRDNIHSALLLYGVRHEGSAAKQPSGFIDDVNNNVKKLDSSLLLVGVRQEARTPGLVDPTSPGGSNLSLSGLQKALSPGGLRRDVLRRSTSLPDLASSEPQLLRECSFSTSASDEGVGIDGRSQWFDSDGAELFFNPDTDLSPPLDGAPASALVAGLFEMADVDAGASMPKSPNVSFGLQQGEPPESLTHVMKGVNRLAAEIDAPLQEVAPPPPPPVCAGATMSSVAAGSISSASSSPSKPAQPQKQAVQSLLQLLKPLQDHHKQLRQTQQGQGRPRQAAEAAPAVATPSADSTAASSPASPPPALGIRMHSPVQQQTNITRRHHRHHMVHIPSQDTAGQAFSSPGSQGPGVQGEPSQPPVAPPVVVLVPQIQAYPDQPLRPTVSPPRMAPVAAGQPCGDAAYPQQYLYTAGQPATNTCLVFPNNSAPMALPRTMH